MKYVKATATADQLSEIAGLEEKTEQLTGFLYMRALGGTKQRIASELGVSRRTLQRWENQLAENLNPEQRHRLITAAVSKEFAERIGEN